MEAADAGVFFGREEEARGLAALVEGPLAPRGGDLVVVLGPSGAGKSSLVRAGLAARLARPGSGWLVADPVEPGARPLNRLAARLAGLAPGLLGDTGCAARLRRDGQTLAVGDGSGYVTLLRQDFSHLNVGYFRRIICGEVRGNLTRGQWIGLVPGQPYRATCPGY